MAWESALDRLITRQIHLAEDGKLADGEVRRLVADYAALASQRPETQYHCGYARTLLGLDFEVPKTAEGRRWFEFGRLKGHLRRDEASFFDDILASDALLLELLSTPAIAAQLLPTLVRRWFADGEFERAVRSLELIDASQDQSSEARMLVDAALLDLLARVEKGTIPIDREGSLRRALHRAMTLQPYQDLGPCERARFERALGASHLVTCEWDEADERLENAIALVDGEVRGDALRRDAGLLRALCRLRVTRLEDLEPVPDRDGREEAIGILTHGLTESADETTLIAPHLHYARGILAYEAKDHAAAIRDFEVAVRVLESLSDSDAARWADRTSFWLGSSLLAGGVREDERHAARRIAQGIDVVEPDIASFYEVFDPLRRVDPKLALRFLDRIDLGRGASPENVLLVGLEYQTLGEPEPALKAATRVLEIATDLDHRIDAYKLRLTAHNMRGDRESARETWFEMRDLLSHRGAFTELERTLRDEALVGQALDHLEIKVELADVYEEMEGKDWDRANLKVQIARAFKARKDVEDLRQAIGLLEEVGVQFPDLCNEDLDNLQKLLELKDDSEGSKASNPMDRFAEILGHRPRILVVGGNERQRKHHPRLEELAREWDFEAEWWMANYASPQKLVAQIDGRLDRCDLLVLLHWNRHETTEPALEKARSKGVPARTIFYAGFTSLQVGLEDVVSKLASSSTAH
ncbi:MAG: hypothetical protein KDC95_15925 [Planctomycetes bacterium]|nr:hypothetical protein [Planctomycetota bacterium]